MTDTQKATSMPWRVVGDRYPIQSPSGNRIPMFVVAVDHPNGPWEAVYCMSENLATQIVTAVNAYDAMREALRECVEFLNHSGNQRAVLAGKFATPSARYEWFQRVRTEGRAALAAAEGKTK